MVKTTRYVRAVSTNSRNAMTHKKVLLMLFLPSKLRAVEVPAKGQKCLLVIIRCSKII